MKYLLKQILPALFVLVGLTGCIKEDRDDCNPGVWLKYDYSLNTERTNLFEAEVDKVTVYVFDEDGLYYGCYSEEGDHLTNSYRMWLPLPVGHYTAVIWGGALGTYCMGEAHPDGTAFQSGLKEGVTHIDDFMLLAENNGQPLEQLDALYHGMMPLVSVFQAEDDVTARLMKDTKRLTVKIQDAAIRGDEAQAPYTVYCEAANGRYRADNRIGEGAALITNRPREATWQSGLMTAQVDLLRLMLDEPLRVVVKDESSRTVFDRDLVGFLRSTGGFGTQEDLDREDEYEVVVTLNQDVLVSVTINGWEAVIITPEPQ